MRKGQSGGFIEKNCNNKICPQIGPLKLLSTPKDPSRINSKPDQKDFQPSLHKTAEMAAILKNNGYLMMIPFDH